MHYVYSGGNPPISLVRPHIHVFAPGANDKKIRTLYNERMHFFSILIPSLEMGTYLAALSLRATSHIDKHRQLSVRGDSVIAYGRDAMQEMVVIRLRELFNATKDDVSKFSFHGFYKNLVENEGIDIPHPNLEVNNAIARIIRRRRFYSAHLGNGKGDYTYSKNRLRSLDLMIALSYVAKIEEGFHQLKEFDPFERLLNDNLEVDRPLVWDSIYEALTGLCAYNEEDEDTPEFAEYRKKADEQLRRLRRKVQNILV